MDTMLIKIKPTRQKSATDQLRRDEAQRHIQRGIAKTAIRAKTLGLPEVDCRGTPLLHANGAANGFGYAELEKRARAYTSSFLVPDTLYSANYERISW